MAARAAPVDDVHRPQYLALLGYLLLERAEWTRAAGGSRRLLPRPALRTRVAAHADVAEAVTVLEQTVTAVGSAANDAMTVAGASGADRHRPGRPTQRGPAAAAPRGLLDPPSADEVRAAPGRVGADVPVYLVPPTRSTTGRSPPGCTIAVEGSTSASARAVSRLRTTVVERRPSSIVIG